MVEKRAVHLAVAELLAGSVVAVRLSDTEQISAVDLFASEKVTRSLVPANILEWAGTKYHSEVR